MQPEWTVADLISNYQKSRHNRLLAPATRRNTQKVYKWLDPLKDRRLDTIAKSEISAILDTMSGGNAHIFLSRLRALFGYARSLDQMTADPCQGLTTPATGEYRPWTQAEVNAFLKSDNATVSMAIKLAYYTGQRMSDVLSMKWSDIKDGYITVVQQKTHAVLSIPVHPKLKSALRQHALKGRSDTIVAMEDGRPYTPERFRDRFRDERKRLGLPEDLVFHGLRKLTAVSLANQGATTQEIMAVGGWASMKQVQHYCKGSDQQKLASRAINRLNRLEAL